MEEKTKAQILDEVEYDIWINLLNVGSYEELGRAVYKRLIETPDGETGTRKIVICGS